MTTEEATVLIKRKSPELPKRSIEAFGTQSQHHDVFLVDQELIFRFNRFEGSVEAVKRERAPLSASGQTPLGDAKADLFWRSCWRRVSLSGVPQNLWSTLLCSSLWRARRAGRSAGRYAAWRVPHRAPRDLSTGAPDLPPCPLWKSVGRVPLQTGSLTALLLYES